MTGCATHLGLLLTGACLCTWGAPLLPDLMGTLPPGSRLCDRPDQEQTVPPGSVADQYDRAAELCMITSKPTPTQPEEDLRGMGGAVAATGHEREVLTDAGEAGSKQGGLAERRAEDDAQRQGSRTETEAATSSLSEEKQASARIPASAEPSAAMDQTRGPGNAMTDGGSSSKSTTTFFALEGERITMGTHTAETMPSAPPSMTLPGPKPDGQGVTQMALERSDPMQPGSLQGHGREEGGIATGLPNAGAPPLGEEGGWEAEITQASSSLKPSDLLNPENGRGALTELTPLIPNSPHGPFSHFPLTINPPLPAQSTTGEAGRPLLGPTRAPEVPLPAATEPQERGPALGLPQSDLLLSSRLEVPGGTWTEPMHSQGVEETSVLPSSHELGTEATMSSEDLPLIFEPFDDVTPPGGSALVPQPSVAMAPTTGMLAEAELEPTVTMDTDHARSDASPPGVPDWPSPWQTSGAEVSDAVSPSRPPISTPFSESEMPMDHESQEDADITQTSEESPLISSATPTSSVTQQIHMTTVTKATHFPVVKPKSGLEELESEEEPDEDEDEDIEESEEEESEEDLTEAPVLAPTRPPYSLIPPPPVWVQRNQGLVRSWVELIREKAGYVSGMLAPVGIGIAGALLIVGALYSIRMIHRKRRNSYKHQRRKQPREVRNGPDQAMLLADSSEDEF